LECAYRLETLTNIAPTPANLAWFNTLDPRDQHWLSQVVPALKDWPAKARVTAAGVYDALQSNQTLIAYHRLRSITDPIVAAYANTDPALTALTARAQAIIDRWHDANTDDNWRQDQWARSNDEERSALQALAPKAVAAWQNRHQPHPAPADQLPSAAEPDAL
jgi:hypothetical protein